MRYVGWILGGVYLLDGILALSRKRAMVKKVGATVMKRLPDRMERTVKRMTNVNDTAMTAMGINNIIAGTGMVLVASLVGAGRKR